MVTFYPTAQPRNVGSAGVIANIPISQGFEGYPVVLFEVEQLKGGSTHATVEFSTDPTFADPGRRIATFEGLNRLNPVAHTNGDLFYSWDGTISGGIIYCRIVAETEVDNDYDIRVHFDEEVTP